jgi:hypothetical protein
MNAAKQLGRWNGIIGQELRVTPSDRAYAVTYRRLPKHAMGNQPALSSEEDDIARGDLFHLAPVNEKNVARPDGGKHAQPCNFQAQRAEWTQDLRSKLTLQCVGAIPGIGVQLFHDTFLFTVQEAWVTLTFPHVKAEVTKIRS